VEKQISEVVESGRGGSRRSKRPGHWARWGYEPGDAVVKRKKPQWAVGASGDKEKRKRSTEDVRGAACLTGQRGRLSKKLRRIRGHWENIQKQRSGWGSFIMKREGT